MIRLLLIGFLVVISQRSFSQRIFDRSVYDSIVSLSEPCDSMQLNDLNTIDYCLDGKKVLQVTYNKDMQIDNFDYDEVAIYHFEYSGDNLIMINGYKTNFEKPDTGFASFIYKYKDNKVIERLVVDKRGDLISGQASWITYDYKGEYSIETNQYDNKGLYVCEGDAYLASTMIYKLDSQNRIIQIDYWCKSNIPFEHIAREIIYYDDSNSDRQRIKSNRLDTIPTQIRHFDKPYYFLKY